MGELGLIIRYVVVPYLGGIFTVVVDAGECYTTEDLFGLESRSC